MKRHAPATARNSVPLADVLAKELPQTGTVLEIASGTGEHAVFFASRFPDLTWQPSDADEESLNSIASWIEESAAANILPPKVIDAARDWPLAAAGAVLCVNMVHISPWSAAEGLFRGAARTLPPRAPLILYGPYLESDVETAPSNRAFDESLRGRNPEWGIRRLEDIDRLAGEHGFMRTARHEMPANNLTVVYRRS